MTHYLVRYRLPSGVEQTASYDSLLLRAIFVITAEAAGAVIVREWVALTIQEAIDKLDAIDESDCEGAHMDADDVLLELVDERVREAYRRLVVRCGWWAHA